MKTNAKKTNKKRERKSDTDNEVDWMMTTTSADEENEEKKLHWKRIERKFLVLI